MSKYDTRQRRALTDYLRRHHDESMTAKAIAATLREQGISQSAVYRNLAALEAEGKVRRVTAAGAHEALYQFADADECRNSLHLSCTNAAAPFTWRCRTRRCWNRASHKTKASPSTRPARSFTARAATVKSSKGGVTMKKTILSLCLSILLLLSAAGCAASRPQSVDRPLHIVTTIFPLYDWTRAILGDSADHVQLDLLLQNGVDLHSFQPTAADIVSIASCDVFIYVGGESDEWVDDALRQSENPNRIVLNLLALLGDAAKEEEIVEGMMQERGHDHGEEEGHDHEDSHEDYITWMNILNRYEEVCAVNEPLILYRVSSTGKSGGKLKSARMRYRAYRYLGFGPVKSAILFSGYAVNGVIKYVTA